LLPVLPAQLLCTAQSWPGCCSRHALPTQQQLLANLAACTAALHGALRTMLQRRGLLEQPTRQHRRNKSTCLRQQAAWQGTWACYNSRAPRAGLVHVHGSIGKPAYNAALAR
jgi:hypothetical protein